VGDAADFLCRTQLNAAPVVDGQGRLVGIVSEKDLLPLVSSAGWSQLPVARIMKHNVVCYDESTPAKIVLDFLCRVTIRRVVIVSGGVPVGTIGRADLLRWFRQRAETQHAGSTPVSRATGVRRTRSDESARAAFSP
jgi:CBS domain-containing protein